MMLKTSVLKPSILEFPLQVKYITLIFLKMSGIDLELGKNVSIEQAFSDIKVGLSYGAESLNFEQNLIAQEYSKLNFDEKVQLKNVVEKYRHYIQFKFNEIYPEKPLSLTPIVEKSKFETYYSSFFHNSYIDQHPIESKSKQELVQSFNGIKQALDEVNLQLERTKQSKASIQVIEKILGIESEIEGIQSALLVDSERILENFEEIQKQFKSVQSLNALHRSDQLILNQAFKNLEQKIYQYLGSSRIIEESLEAIEDVMVKKNGIFEASEQSASHLEIYNFVQNIRRMEHEGVLELDKIYARFQSIHRSSERGLNPNHKMREDWAIESQQIGDRKTQSGLEAIKYMSIGIMKILAIIDPKLPEPESALTQFSI